MASLGLKPTKEKNSMKNIEKKVVTRRSSANRKDAVEKLVSNQDVKPLESPDQATPQAEKPESDKPQEIKPLPFMLCFPSCKFNMEVAQRRISAYSSNAGRIRQVVIDYAAKEFIAGEGKTVIQYDGSNSPLLDAGLIGRMVKAKALPVNDPAAFLRECRAVVGMIRALNELTA